MPITTSHLIQILQLIILAFTAEIFISQFALRLFQKSNVADILQSAEDDGVMSTLRNGVQTVFVSIAFFAIGGTFLSVYLILIAVPDEVRYFLDLFESNWMIFGGLCLLIVLAMALAIGGDTENPGKGLIGAAVGSFLTGAISFFIILVYFVLLAATRSPEWIFFISMICVAFAMATFLFGSLIMGESLLSAIEELENSRQ